MSVLPAAGALVPRTNGRLTTPDHLPFPPRPGSGSFDEAEAEAEMTTEADDNGDDDFTRGPRHGLLLQPDMDEYAILLETPYMPHWCHKRHLSSGNPKPMDPRDKPNWRIRERVKTVTGALVMCLNLGIDPPDVCKTKPCSKLLCWMDPTVLEPSKALPAIGKNLQAQFETLSSKMRYKQYLDPIVEETKRFCTNLRRTAKDDRVLFYYSGFGVPKPTPGGEIWVFNKGYSQYIPVTLYDLQLWLGSPCIFIWDASAAGNIIVNFRLFSERRREEENKTGASDSKQAPRAPTGSPAALPTSFPARESIHLAACGPDETLPMNPDLPADLFTSCLTSPIEISLRWFVIRNPLPQTIKMDDVMKIPGRLSDRRTPLGELNWIFTAITDTIAWTVFPREIFRRLYRDDLMVAALCRNFLLAERIMRFYHCHPMSHPALPPTHEHPLWGTWDLIVDQCLAQLPALLAREKASEAAAAAAASQVAVVPGQTPTIPPASVPQFDYKYSTFFSDQLKAFEVWLARGAIPGKVPTGVTVAADAQGREPGRRHRDPPEQLPTVLQVLLSQMHRLRALILLSQFLDLGPWAVNLALSIGIFPYVLRLLQSPAADLKPVLIYVWARILAVDRSCQNDLIRESGYSYFTNVLSPFRNSGELLIPNVSEHRAMCAFIVAVFCKGFSRGQALCFETDALEACLEHLSDEDYLLRQWSCLCIAELWNDYDQAKGRAIRIDAHVKVCAMLSDVSPEVRAAALYALGTLLGASGSQSEADSEGATPRKRERGTGIATNLSEGAQRKMEIGIGLAALTTKSDSSPLVRKEFVIALSALVYEYRGAFVVAAYLYHVVESEADGERRAAELLLQLATATGCDGVDFADFTAVQVMYDALLDLSVDSHGEVASLASTTLDFINALMMESDLIRAADSGLPSLEAVFKSQPATPAFHFGGHEYFGPQVQPLRPSTPRSDGAPIENGAHSNARQLNPKRSSSFAATVKSIATLGYSRPPSPTGFSDGSGHGADGLTHGPSNRTSMPAVPTSPAQYQSPYSQPSLSLPVTPANSAPSRSLSAESLQHIRARAEGAGDYRRKGGTSSKQQSQAADSPRVADVLLTLLQSDTTRFRMRAQTQTPAPAGAGMASQDTTVREVLPLQSRLFEWSSEYYTEPQMRSAEAEEPGSLRYNAQSWKRQRNEKMVLEASAMAEEAGKRRWNQHMGTLHLSAQPSKLLFHQFEPHLVSITESDTISVWDWETKTCTNRFKNGNPPNTAITTALFVNEDVEAMLLVGSAEGDVRIYRNYEQADSLELATSFRALPDLVKSKHPSGLIANWQQVRGHLLVGGDSKVIRVWDAHRELCVSDIPTRAGSCVTSITSEVELGHVFVAGFGDGGIGVYDRRLRPGEALVRLWEEHQSWLQSVHLQRRGNRELVSASVDGDVRIWDIRSDMSLSHYRTSQILGGNLSAMAVHEQAPVFAVASVPRVSRAGLLPQNIGLFNVSGGPSLIGAPIVRAFPPTTSAGLPGAPNAPTPATYRPSTAFSPSVSALAFHPHQMIMAYGGPDSLIELRRCPPPRRPDDEWFEAPSAT